MSFANIVSSRRILVGLAALLIALPLTYAQQRPPQRDSEPARPAPRQSEPARPAPPRQSEPARAPVERKPVVVDRTNHGSIRHVDTHVVTRPIDVRHGVDVRHDVVSHRDVEVDVHHPRFWNNFAFGRRWAVLPVGYVSVMVNGSPYYYNDGIYYQPSNGAYQEVYPPVGADVSEPPDGAIAIDAGGITYYYAGGAFYVQQGDGYVIAPTPIGVTVPELPPGAVQVSVNGNVAYQFNGIYYQPEFVDGVTQYVTFMP